MSTSGERWVPKVHPGTRSVEAEDPMELVAAPVQGDPDFMLQCLIEEFAWMGLGPDELMNLFQSPNYPVLNQLLEHHGQQMVRQRIEAFAGLAGLLRFQEVIADQPEPQEDFETELIQLSIRKRTEDPTE